MCRWLLYYGHPIVPGTLLYQHDNGLIVQSESHSHTPGLPTNQKRNHEVNTHGSGLGWYPLRLKTDQSVVVIDRSMIRDDPGVAGLTLSERPVVYTGAGAPSNDRNLRRISESVQACGTPTFTPAFSDTALSSLSG